VSKRIKSSVVIARLLKSEGFNDHVAGIVEQYWRKTIIGPKGRSKMRKLDKEITDICKKLTDADRLILGKFIAAHKAMSFDAGLRIGLTAFARKTDKEYEIADKPGEVTFQTTGIAPLQRSAQDEKAGEKP
jgi:hypothetical protein